MIPVETAYRRKGDFSRYLEQRARELVSSTRGPVGGSSVTTMLEQEILLTLEQLDGLRALQDRQLRSLCRTECYVDTELMQMEERTPRYSPYRFPEREKFQNRLFLIEAERRKGAVFYEERMQGLQRKLLSLMQKHDQLSVQGGGPEDLRR